MGHPTKVASDNEWIRPLPEGCLLVFDNFKFFLFSLRPQIVQYHMVWPYHWKLWLLLAKVKTGDRQDWCICNRDWFITVHSVIGYLTDVNLTTVSKNTYVTGFLGSFQIPNPNRPPCNKYGTYLTINSKGIQPIIKLGTIYAPGIWKDPRKP